MFLLGSWLSYSSDFLLQTLSIVLSFFSGSNFLSFPLFALLPFPEAAPGSQFALLSNSFFPVLSGPVSQLIAFILQKNLLYAIKRPALVSSCLTGSPPSGDSVYDRVLHSTLPPLIIIDNYAQVRFGVMINCLGVFKLSDKSSR